MLRISRIKFSSMSNCEQIAAWLLGMLSCASAVCLTPGRDIMTYRVARATSNLLLTDLAFCCECGSADLEVCYTSKALGPHLCQACAQSMVECGTWKEPQTRSRMRERLSPEPMPRSHVRFSYERQIKGGSLLCQRCRGLLVRETFDGLSPEAGNLCMSTRCINCGYIEDSVVRANRLHSLSAKRMAPRR